PLDPLAVSQQGGTSAPAAGNNPSATAAHEPSGDVAQSNRPIRVETTLTDQSWLRVVADGKTQFEGILQQGENRTWTADQQLTVRAGNAGGVVVSYNEGQAQALGKPGMVAEITYSPDQTVGLAF
ncbi:MAG TPA: DUF4115 domain-containing protein, partial [Trichocoleus sp.]